MLKGAKMLAAISTYADDAKALDALANKRESKDYFDLPTGTLCNTKSIEFVGECMCDERYDLFYG